MQCIDHCLREPRRIPQGGELDQPYPVRERLSQLPGHPQRQSGLADAAEPGQRDHPGGRQQLSDVGNLLPATHKTGHIGWKVVQTSVL
jgi:hypothetical protein